MRGDDQADERRVDDDVGNTPACAGTTRCSTRRSRTSWEHPRVRGDDALVHDGNYLVSGTLPRARGRPPQHVVDDPRRGNTPTCAGTTGSAPSCPGSGGEHPRVRGDDGGKPGHQAICIGTPPRARGRPSCRSFSDSRFAEHPRVRGDDSPTDVNVQGMPGTPPRARGRLECAGPSRAHARNTPACAGTTNREPRSNPLRPEHPRVRGDDSACISSARPV